MINTFSKANEKWQKDLEWIVPLAEKTKREFYWFQLIHQEILMYLKLNEQVSLKEFDWLINRRGFNLKERLYLQEMLKYVGLWEGKND